MVGRSSRHRSGNEIPRPPRSGQARSGVVEGRVRVRRGRCAATSQSALLTPGDVATATASTDVRDAESRAGTCRTSLAGGAACWCSSTRRLPTRRPNSTATTARKLVIADPTAAQLHDRRHVPDERCRSFHATSRRPCSGCMSRTWRRDRDLALRRADTCNGGCRPHEGGNMKKLNYLKSALAGGAQRAGAGERRACRRISTFPAAI